MKRALLGGGAFLLLLALGLLLAVKLRYGGGGDFPNRVPGPPRLPESALELVAELPTPPGNIAVSSGGRVFVTLHPEARPAIKVAELVDGKAVPFPNEAFQTGAGEPRHFRDVLSLRIDGYGRLWTLDNGGHGRHPGRLLAFDPRRNEVLVDYEFPRAIAGLGSHLNDFQVSLDGRTVFIADASLFARTPALIVFDIEKREARRVLEGQPSVTPEFYTPVVDGRRMEAYGLVAVRPGVDSIALDANGQWLYFAPVTSTQLYRIRSGDLVDSSLSAADLAARVETYAPKTMTDGLTMDGEGNIYLSDPEHSAILLLKPDRTLETLLQTPRLRWPDGFSFGPDGWLYVSCSSLHQVIGLPQSSVAAHAPYPVFRFKAPVAGIPGH
ncbi:hypothetical protein D0B54_17290 [Solimonas sp. K1W22B-7]|uniref:SMP-30/gluconolactonase/LRE family protein n=1 Tax=Solimonas sp. K1W22B-7 TaxID=2303331 RepID=UPI000E330F0D|nr:L-dopachrome tautomerase-related protein [Solimonas sp. K1W22B-7]AXQ30317.1 hypothetical protein D0B54_17290 [Solimonas sp. K1W22B-7]